MAAPAPLPCAWTRPLTSTPYWLLPPVDEVPVMVRAPAPVVTTAPLGPIRSLPAVVCRLRLPVASTELSTDRLAPDNVML